jgi:phosphoglycolate phosphatase
MFMLLIKLRSVADSTAIDLTLGKYAAGDARCTCLRRRDSIASATDCDPFFCRLDVQNHGIIGPHQIGIIRLKRTGRTETTVIFDLDGTLVDTAPDLVETLNVVLAREGLAAIPYEEGRTLVGGGARYMIERGLASHGKSRTKADLDRLFGDFIAYYSLHAADRSRAFPGVEEALDVLAAEGYRLAVCTNKLERLSMRVLDALGLSRRFAAICGQDTFGVQKPNPDFLRRTLERAGGVIDRAIMVGDSPTDIATAQAAGIPVIAVDFGYTNIPVSQLAPDRIISHFNDLSGSITELLALRDSSSAPSRALPGGA